MADYLTRLDFNILNELGYLPFAGWRSASVPPDQQALRAHLDHRFTTNVAFGEWPSVFDEAYVDCPVKMGALHLPNIARLFRMPEFVLIEQTNWGVFCLVVNGPGGRRVPGCEGGARSRQQLCWWSKLEMPLGGGSWVSTSCKRT